MAARPDFSTPPHPLPWIALQPSWMLNAQASVSSMRRIWSVRPNRVSARCWRWITAGYGPPWNGESK